jgi:hypothetical protein
MGMPGGYGNYVPGGNTAGATPTSVTALDQNLTSRPIIPSYFPFPLQVLVAPYMPYSPTNNVADIVICDTNALGAYIVDQDVTTDQWEDMSTDTTKIKLKERYTFAVYDDGLGIGVLRNVPIKANEIALPVQATISAEGQLAELNVGTAISGL